MARYFKRKRYCRFTAEGVDEILDETKDTTEILSQYIDGLETTIDKVKVKTVLDDLYHEALSL